MKVARENMDSGFESSERNEASRAGQRIQSLRGDEGKQVFPLKTRKGHQRRRCGGGGQEEGDSHT